MIVSLNAWRPMESAPKDGTRILVTDGDEVLVAEWRAVKIAYPDCRPTWGWYVPYSDQDEQGGAHEAGPIGWMPLPRPSLD